MENTSLFCYFELYVINIIQGYCVSYIVLHLSLKDMLIEVFQAHNYCYVGVEFYIELIIWSHHSPRSLTLCPKKKRC